MNKKRTITSLEVVLKIVERCNLNCSYCYFFNAGDENYKNHPPFISLETVHKIAKFLVHGAQELKLERIVIDLHGGEPLLLPVKVFDQMCTIFRETLSPYLDLILSVQTNGTIINDNWINCFSKHNIFVGISCDGPPDLHDKFRIDHKGRGSHEKVVANLKKMKDAESKKLISAIGLLCVIDPTYDAKTVYDHFTKDLNMKIIDFMLPDVTHDTFKGSQDAFGKYLCRLFDIWVNDDDPSIQIRILSSALKLLMGFKAGLSSAGPIINGYETITIASNGEVGPDDALRSASPSYLDLGKTVFNTSLKSLLDHPFFEIPDKAIANLPQQCKACEWKNICQGGYLVHRYSRANAFNNPSVICPSLKQFYSRVMAYLIDHGYQKEKILNLLS
jgi:uncharacterized protein